MLAIEFWREVQVGEGKREGERKKKKKKQGGKWMCWKWGSE